MCVRSRAVGVGAERGPPQPHRFWQIHYNQGDRSCPPHYYSPTPPPPGFSDLPTALLRAGDTYSRHIPEYIEDRKGRSFGCRVLSALPHSTPRHRLALVSTEQEGRHTLLCQKNACRRQLAAPAQRSSPVVIDLRLYPQSEYISSRHWATVECMYYVCVGCTARTVNFVLNLVLLTLFLSIRGDRCQISSLY